MPKVESQPKDARPVSGKCQSAAEGGMTCIWCHLIKEGVKKAYSGIRRRTGRTEPK